jgi:uncharacterized protein (DUF924 family)
MPLGPNALGYEPEQVVQFWQAAGPAKWFAKDVEFDREFRERFLKAHESASRGELDAWTSSPVGSLGLLLLLDQFPRNAFRGTPRAYATDTLARHHAHRVLALGHDQSVDPMLRLFFYLPFGHSESLLDQERCIALSEPLGPEIMKHARGHYDIIARFGRFPHRNALLERPSSVAELEFLAQGGFGG